MAQKGLNCDSKDKSSILETRTSGYSSAIARAQKACSLSIPNKVVVEDTVTESVPFSVHSKEKCDNFLAARTSMARTSLSITSYINTSFNGHKSSHTITSWVMSNNMTRLKTAYRYLTPIIDEIISRATNYSQKEFKEILFKRQPICSISYTQYIRAFQASEIITQVGKELGAMSTNMPYQVDYAINNAETIKREDLLETIERMADRIFIDRDLMKQLVNLHELIIDTIKKLKTSLDQVSIEGLPQEARLSKKDITSKEKREIIVDKDAIRRNIAEHFIVIGEPRTKGCYCYSGPDVRAEVHSQEPTVVNQKSHVFTAGVDGAGPLEHAKEKKSHKSKCKRSKIAFGPKALKLRKHKNAKSSSIFANLPPPPDQDDNLAQRHIYHTGHTEADLSQSEYDTIAKKSTPFTVGLRPYELKCTDGVTKACAVHPEELAVIRHSDNNPQHNYNDIEDEDLPVMADSDSQEHLQDTENEKYILASPTSSIKLTMQSPNISEQIEHLSNKESVKSVPHLEPAIHITSNTHLDDDGCTEHCKHDTEMPCQDEFNVLRNMIKKIRDQLMYLKSNDIIDFEYMEEHEEQFPSLDKEHRVMQEVMHCLEELETIKKCLLDMNFMEITANSPEKIGCCYRENTHVHANIRGIPIIVNISPSLIEVLNAGYPFTRSDVKAEEVKNQLSVKPTINKACACKPPTLKSLIKEKFALAKMIKTRNETHNQNKFVMMSVDPLLDNIFGMQANSLVVETAYQKRDPDVFQIMDMADSNTSLPYVVNRSSLPNVTTCPTMEITVQQLRHQVRNIAIEHPKPRIQRELQDIGLNNLLKASIPAKCCNAIALNRTESDNEPYHASLNSLPLTTSDLQMIVDLADEESYVYCNYQPIHYFYTASIQFKFERYTNFQENVKFFVPKCPVYFVYYFEIFKRGVDLNEHMARINGRRRTTHGSQFSRHSRREREYNSRYRQTQENRYETHTKSMFSEFFRRFLFVMTNEERDIESDYNEYKNKGGDRRPKKKGSKQRKSKQDYHPLKQVRSQNAKTKKRLKNQRLQTGLDDEEYCELGSVKTPGKTDLNRVSSSMKNYYISSSQTKYKISVSHDSATNCKNVKKKASHQKDLLSERKSSTSFRNKCIMNESIPNLEEELVPSLNKSDSKPLDEGSDSIEKFERALEFSTSSHNLGTIFETEEKAMTIMNSPNSPSNFLDFLRTSELSKSFQRFIETEQASGTHENNQIEPDEFWNKYFKQRRDSRSPAPTMSGSVNLETDPIAPIEEIPNSSTQPTLVQQLPSTQEPRKKLTTKSKIPQRICKPKKSTSNVSMRKPSLNSIRPFPGKRESLHQSSFASVITPRLSKVQCAKSNLTVLNRMHSNPLQMSAKSTKADVYFSEILNEADKNAAAVTSMYSLKVLATKNGPGYVAVLHPACGCPEVSIFIPCYCDEKGLKRAGLTSKQMARMAANTNGRHILLPVTCRVPRTKHTPKNTACMNNCRVCRY